MDYKPDMITKQDIITLESGVNKLVKHYSNIQKDWELERATLLAEIKHLKKRLRWAGQDNIQLRHTIEKLS